MKLKSNYRFSPFFFHNWTECEHYSSGNGEILCLTLKHVYYNLDLRSYEIMKALVFIVFHSDGY